MPPDLNAALATESVWLQGWVMLLVIIHLLAIPFVVKRGDHGLRPRTEAIAIVISFVAAAIALTWLYSVVGYVRLLGLPHLLFWTPVYVWLAREYRNDRFSFPFKPYLLGYFAIAGTSLVIDALDVLRYLLGDATPLHLA